MNENTRMEFKDWKEMKRQERDAVIVAQRDALEAVFKDGESLKTYLEGRGRLGSHLTAGNAALVLQVNPAARVVMNYENWKRFGRSVGKQAEGISTLTRNNGYLNVEKVYEISQTYGNKPYPSLDIAEDTKQLNRAIEVLSEICLVPFERDSTLCEAIVYEDQSKKVLWNPESDLKEAFRQLPVAMIRATTDIHADGDSKQPFTVMFATAVSVELCGKFGVRPADNAAEILGEYRSWVEAGKEREALEHIREMAKTMGDHIAKGLVAHRTDPQSLRQEAR